VCVCVCVCVCVFLRVSSVDATHNRIQFSINQSVTSLFQAQIAHKNITQAHIDKEKGKRKITNTICHTKSN